jgi:predicted DNA-binding helix-hairpin-helix protein
MDLGEKLSLLGGSATDDKEKGEAKAALRCTQVPGVFPVKLPGGKTMPLFRTMLTNACSLSCNYCATRCGRKLRRTTITPEELAKAYVNLYGRGLAKGLFLTSGIPGDPVRVMDKLLAACEILRKKYGYRDYIHLKILPGVEMDQIRRATELASRVSLNLEAPTDDHLHAIAPEKRLSQDLLPRLTYAGQLAKSSRQEGGRARLAPAGITTQFVVGAAGEQDRQILQLVARLEGEGLLHHAHFSPFVPITDTPLEANPAAAPLRGHRLYQAEHLLRQYGFGLEELPFDASGNLPLHLDPKLAWALAHPERFPVELTSASYEELLRVPGIGPKAAWRILKERRRAHLRGLEDLASLGAVSTRVAGFVTWRGKRLGRFKAFGQPSLWQADLRTPTAPRATACSPGAFR